MLITLNFCSIELMSQEQLETIDLGVFKGELKLAERTLFIDELVEQPQLTISNTEVTIISVSQDSVNVTSALKLNIGLKNRIGRFFDTLSVFDKDDILSSKLLIQYQILDPVGDVFKSYRNEHWPFKSREQVFNLRIGHTGETLTRAFDLFNFSGETLSLEGAEFSDSIKVYFEPNYVPSNSFTRMHISYQTTSSSDLGFTKLVLTLVDNEDTIAFVPIQYSLIPQETPNGAKLLVTRDNLDYKVVKKGDLISEVILLSNSGSEPLEVYKVETNCSCLTAEVSNTQIAPGANTELRFRLDTQDRGGLERKTISIFTNDATTRVKNIVIKAHVKLP